MRACSSCGEENPDRARFCLACGTELGAAAAREERKLVTVLFADIVGFTTRSDRADPEDVKATLLPFHTRAKQIVEEHGGIVDKFIGDAVMGVFGSPEAHEDDPERAVRSALAMLAALPEINAAHPGLNLAIRVGVNTGEAVVAFGRGPQIGEAVAGDVVNTASRLQGVAKPGEVVAGEATWRATSDAIEYDELEPVRVKGKADALRVWRARRARQGDHRAHRGAFVGRAAEVRTITDAYERCLRDRNGALVLVAGEPGIGKSRLVREFRDRACTGTGTQWRRGTCVAYGAGALDALEEIVRAEAGVADGDDDRAIAAKLEVSIASPDATERAWILARLGPLLGIAQDDRPQLGESFAAWRRFFELRATERPLVIEIADLHWADDALLGFLDHIASSPPSAPVFVLCTARLEIAERRPSLVKAATAVSLRPLDAEDTAELVRALSEASGIDIGAEAVDRVIERSAGNALFAEEFVRLIADGDASADVPQTVQALIATRIDGLGPETKQFLRDASVVGAAFWSGALQAMGHGDVASRLAELERRQLVHPAPTSSIEGEPEFRFWHALIRDVAYAQVPRGERSDRHQAAAAWLEERAGGAQDLIAHHATEALTLGRAAGRETAGLEAAAVRALVAAGNRAMALETVRAQSLFDRALDLLSEGAPDRAAVQWKAITAGRRSGTLTGEDGARAYKGCIDAFRARGDDEALGEALVRYSTFIATQGNTAGARQVQDEAIALLEARPPSRALAVAYVARAEERMYDGLIDEALEWSRKAIAVASEPGLDGAAEQTCYALTVRGHARLERGDLGGMEDFATARGIAIEGGESMAAAVTHSAIAEWTWLIGGPVSGIAVYDEVIAFAKARGIGTHVMWATAERVQLLYDSGRWDDALRGGDDIAAWEAEKGLLYLSVLTQSYRSIIETRRGDVASALERMPGLLSSAREIGDLQILVPALTIAAVIERDAGRTPLPLAEEIESMTKDRAPEYRLAHLAEIVDLAIGAGDTRLAERLLEVPALPAARAHHAIQTGKALVAESLGATQEALDLFEQASEGWQTLGAPFERSRTLLGAARCLAATGKTDDALIARNTATTILSKLGVPAPR